MNILQAIRDENLFAPFFRDRETWVAWTALLAALFALPMTPEQLAIYRECTGREGPPSEPQRQAWLVVGRRGGKSFILALIAVFLACFFDYRKYLAPGERGVVLLIAADKRQAKILLGYITALLEGVPMLARMIQRRTSEAVDLNNGISIEVRTCNYRTVRGVTLVCALLDELAFWRTDDSVSPDTEVLTALEPATASIPNSHIIGASSPYAKRGLLYDKDARHFGKDDGPLVWRAGTRTMNPTIPQSLIDKAMEADPNHAGAEYLAIFRSDVEAFLSREAVLACVDDVARERKPERRNRYVAFVDPSGGSADSMTLAIAHKEGDTPILDALRENRPPFSPEGVVEEYADLCRSYRITRVYGDRYAGEWPREQFRKRGIVYDVADKTKSQLYQAMLPLVNSGACDLLNEDRLVTQLASLERRVTRGGRDSIDHRPGGHDDLANAAAGAIVLANEKRAGSAVDVARLPTRTNSAMSNSRYLAGSFRQAG